MKYKIILFLIATFIPIMSVNADACPEEVTSTIDNFFTSFKSDTSVDDSEYYNEIIKYKDISITYNITNCKPIEEDKYNIKINFNASAGSWNESGITANFELTHDGDKYIISSTNLFGKLGPSYIFKFIVIIWEIIIGVFALIFIIVLIAILIHNKNNKKRKINV